MGDAYGCGIVEHLSRLELKKLDEDAELELSKAHHATSHPIEHFPNKNPSISIWNEADQQLDQSERRNSAKSYNSNTGGNTTHFHHQEANQESPPQQPHQSDPEQIPIVVIDSEKRNARQLLFNNPKLPTSVNSMPHISQYSSNTKNNNGVNQDSNV